MTSKPQDDDGPEVDKPTTDGQQGGNASSAGEPESQAPETAAGAVPRTADQAMRWSKTMADRYGPSVKERGVAAAGWMVAKARTTAGRRAFGGLLALMTLRGVFRARRRRRNRDDAPAEKD